MKIRLISLILLGFLSGLAAADTLTLLSDDQSRLQAHIMAVREAQTEVSVSFAFMHNDAVGRCFLAELVAAANRGVRVNLLLDNLGNHLPRNLMSYLIHNGVNVRFYHAVTANPRSWNADVSWIWQRMHDKLVVADGRVLVTGSENMGDSYYRTLAPGPGQGFSGRNVRIEGGTASTARGYFENIWGSAHVTSPSFSPRLPLGEFDRQSHLLDEARRLVRIPEELPVSPHFEIEPNQLDFVNSRDGSLRQHMLELIGGARRSIVVETPYLLLDSEVSALLIAKARTGVVVTILTNSAQSNNHPVGNPLYQSEARRLLREGIQVREWTGNDTLHGKTVVVDDERTLVTTRNFNLRSARHDSEIGVILRDPRAARAVLSDLRVERFAELPTETCSKKVLRRVLGALLRPGSSQF